MGSHNIDTAWTYQYYVFYLAWWWFKGKETCRRIFNIDYQYIYICCVIDWINFYIISKQRDGSYQNKVRGISQRDEEKLAFRYLRLSPRCCLDIRFSRFLRGVRWIFLLKCRTREGFQSSRVDMSKMNDILALDYWTYKLSPNVGDEANCATQRPKRGKVSTICFSKRN